MLAKNVEIIDELPIQKKSARLSIKNDQSNVEFDKMNSFSNCESDENEEQEQDEDEDEDDEEDDKEVEQRKVFF